MSGAKAVREDRLWQRHADMSKLGGTPKGGVNRQALSAEDAAARNLLASWAKARGFAIFTDAIGNLFVRREGSDVTALPVMSGSHMDSQPTGGRFDGMYGVLAAFGDPGGAVGPGDDAVRRRVRSQGNLRHLAVPGIENAERALALRCVPDGAVRRWRDVMRMRAARHVIIRHLSGPRRVKPEREDRHGGDDNWNHRKPPYSAA